MRLIRDTSSTQRETRLMVCGSYHRFSENLRQNTRRRLTCRDLVFLRATVLGDENNRVRRYRSCTNRIAAYQLDKLLHNHSVVNMYIVYYATVAYLTLLTLVTTHQNHSCMWQIALYCNKFGCRLRCQMSNSTVHFQLIPPHNIPHLDKPFQQ